MELGGGRFILPFLLSSCLLPVRLLALGWALLRALHGVMRGGMPTGMVVM